MNQTTKPLGLIYLACPYSHESAEVRETRAQLADQALAWMMQQGLYQTFSPISHTARAANATALPLDWEFWKASCEVYLHHSSALAVLMIDGWQTSTGVQAEYALAKRLGLLCLQLHYDGRNFELRTWNDVVRPDSLVPAEVSDAGT